MLSFDEWLKLRESSAFTRLRMDSFLGLKPPISPASMHSRSTFPYVVVKKKKKKNK